MVTPVVGEKGKTYTRGTADYDNVVGQYATSTYGEQHDMQPDSIIFPADRNEVSNIIKRAMKEKIAVSVRTGGHQYSGASSTGGRNFQLDLSQTFRTDSDGPDSDRLIVTEADRTLAYTSVSWTILEFNAWLGKNKVFVPHGQCGYVGLGGHVQTGGYGQLARSFGLLGDHVRRMEIIDCEGNIKEISRESDPDLFYAFLGGSPGNLGVLTHLTLEVHRDVDYEGSYGLKALFKYDPESVKALLGIMTEMADNCEFPRNYDYCVTVKSAGNPIDDIFPGKTFPPPKDGIKVPNPEPIPSMPAKKVYPAVIIVFAQWVKLNVNDKFEGPPKDWFDRIIKAGEPLQSGQWPVVQQLPMSTLTAAWVFPITREFELPYVKRTYLTKSASLSANKWTDWVTDRMDEVIGTTENGQWLSCQYQCFGGKHSRFATNANNGTSFSWRDSTVGATMDNFHRSTAKSKAGEWQRKNDEQGIGAKGKFSEDDRRVLWGSYGDYDLHSVRRFYYEDEAKYGRLQEVRKKADPDGVFTPNPFCVKRAA